MKLKEHIDLAISIAEKNNCYTSSGLSTRNPQKSIYRLVDVINEIKNNLLSLNLKSNEDKQKIIDILEKNFDV